MDPDEQALQREGYLLAQPSSRFLQALREGAHIKVFITYFEWAGQLNQKIIMPWVLINGAGGRRRIPPLSGRLYRRASADIDLRCAAFCRSMLDDSGYRGLRGVIDVLGDAWEQYGGGHSFQFATINIKPASQSMAYRSMLERPRCRCSWISKASTFPTRTA